MKLKYILTALVLFTLTATSAVAATRYVSASGSNTFTSDPDGAGPLLSGDPNTCSFSSDPCATVSYALTEASPGDIISIESGTYTEGSILINKDFITIEGPNAGTPGFATRGSEAVFTGTVAGPHEYIFAIAAHNVTIDGIQVDADGDEDIWAAVRIMEGGWDRWTIRNNILQEVLGMDGLPAPGVSNFSYGIYGDAQVSSGNETMTGGLIAGNWIHQLGKSTHLTGANTTSGVGIYLEGIEGEDAACNPIDRFGCGVWIYENRFEDLFTGQNQSLQGVTTPGGKEYSYGIFIAQDAENAQPNNGAWIGRDEDATPSWDGNEYMSDDALAASATPLEIGIRIAIGGSTVNEASAVFNGTETVAMIVNEGRKAFINETTLSDFYKSLYPRIFGEGSDLYAFQESNIIALSEDEATLVYKAGFLSVQPRGSSVSYKISLDNEGLLNVRTGARLLYKGPQVDVRLLGTPGDDLMTADFSKGNPFSGRSTFNDNELTFITEWSLVEELGGFDSAVFRGDAQLDDLSVKIMARQATALVDVGIEFNPVLVGNSPMGSAPVNALYMTGVQSIDDLLIVNGKYSVIMPSAAHNEINVINGPFRYGFDTLQINPGQDGHSPTSAVPIEGIVPTINFANKKQVHIFGGNNYFGGETDVFTVFTEDGKTPNLLNSLHLWGGWIFTIPQFDTLVDGSDDYFVIRPSADFPIYVNGGTDGDNGDWGFVDCAGRVTAGNECRPDWVVTGTSGDIHTDFTSPAVEYENVFWSGIDNRADAPGYDVDIRKELVGFATNGAHPGDDLEYRVTIVNNTASPINLDTDNGGYALWVTDVIDHRLSLVEQSIVVEAGSVDFAGNRGTLWRINDIEVAPGESVSMTYTVIVNTLITSEQVGNWASILNGDDSVSEYVENGYDNLEHYAYAELDVLDVFGFPVKAAIQASLFYETEAGPRYMVGLYAGAKDPAQGNIGAMLCRVPDTNRDIGWDGGLGNLWYSCGEGLPAKEGLFSPLVITDLYQDSAGRIWLTSWGFDGLYFSDDGGQTWTSALVDLSGGQGGAPDGEPDGFAQVYSITEDILGTLFISANNGDVYRSFDRGETWQKAKQLPLGSADTAYSLEADPTEPGTLYAGTFGDGLYVTRDFGETWAKPDLTGLLNGYIFDIELDPQSGNLFVGTAKGLFYSTDQGDSWDGLNTAFPFPTNPPEVRSIAFDGDGSLFASTWGQGVWASSDWQASALSDFALKSANVLDLSVSNGYVHVLTDTGATFRFAYEGRASSVDTEDVAAELPSGFALEQNYPNPFNPTTSIAFSLPQSAQVNLTVYDVLGRRVATLVNGNLASGQHQVQFEASSLPSGMYLYRLTTPTGSITQKMMLLK